MPITIPEALDAHEALAVAKATQARTSLPRYLLSSAMAGAYVGVAVVLLLMVERPAHRRAAPLRQARAGLGVRHRPHARRLRRAPSCSPATT